ncbi:GerMN domain-containing protein [Christensenella tenuis]|uniref:GerMN domain-containing protein n=1 Tax=Christensenella tenuis TaxID=2763033 RepID=A0ABR7ECA8_9FIRM|nr:GerMN domain-containing protein [Christensenella tenuis]MBC5647273.1 GerMN domain-containing protein [Christensenella tenuis]
MKKGKKLICIVLCSLLILGASACAQQDTEPSATASEETAIQINPLPEAVSKDKETARLYFGYMQEALLIGEVRVFSVPINENSEASIIAELIKGPSTARADFTQLINPNTKVVNVAQDGTFLSVTLSKEFLTPPEDTSADGAENEAYEETRRRMLATYSIVNTIVEQGNFSRVQIYIDDDGTGTGRPLTLEEAGLDGEGATEALERKGDLDLNGRNTLREIMNCIENKSWDTLYRYISFKNLYGEDKPSLEEFKSEITTAKLVVSDVEIGDEIQSADDLTEVVMASYVLKLRDGDAKTISNVPIRLILENDVWKMTYTTFKRNFLS